MMMVSQVWEMMEGPRSWMTKPTEVDEYWRVCCPKWAIRGCRQENSSKITSPNLCRTGTTWVDAKGVFCLEVKRVIKQKMSNIRVFAELQWKEKASHPFFLQVQYWFFEWFALLVVDGLHLIFSFIYFYKLHFHLHILLMHP